MSRRPSPNGHGPGDDKATVVVAGPGSSLTIPGLIVSEIVQSLARTTPVIRVEVDLGIDYAAGLHRAPSLAAAHDAFNDAHVARFRAPANPRLRTQAFREWIGPDIDHAIAYAWPGIDNSWIRAFIQAARHAGATTTVVCASLPSTKRVRATSLADLLVLADQVIVGDEADARELRALVGSTGPQVLNHRALSLGGRDGRHPEHIITAFMPRDNAVTLTTLLAAFDAIPEAWIDSYFLQVVMRHSSDEVPAIVANCYHADHVRLLVEDISNLDLEQLCATSSALIIADPAFDSRAFETAVRCGVATVVLALDNVPDVGRGYVGGLLADINRPVSVHVALTHALRLAELQFPGPEAWDELATLMVGVPEESVAEELAPAVPIQ